MNEITNKRISVDRDMSIMTNYGTNKLINELTNKRIAALIILTLLSCSKPAHGELTNNMSADVVVGQPDFNSNSINQGGAAGANTLNNPSGVFSDGKRLFICEESNNRVLIFNSIPVSNNASADVVVGQQNFTATAANQGVTASPKANTLYNPAAAYVLNGKLYIVDRSNSRVLIYNSIPASNNASADMVLGQSGFTTQTANQGGIGANTLAAPTAIWSDDKKLIISDHANRRFLVFNTIPTFNKAPADVVIGQSNFTSNSQYQGGSAAANNLGSAYTSTSDGKILILNDPTAHRVLVYSSIPQANNASANVVIGQSDFLSVTANQGGGVGPNTLSNPKASYFDGKRLFIWDRENHRVLVFNSLPTSNNASADMVIGQASLLSGSPNQGGQPGANTLQGSGKMYQAIHSDGRHLFIADTGNHRVLIYNIGSSSIKNGPQFDQGKALIGKVFNDVNSNGIQDTYEQTNERTNELTNKRTNELTNERINELTNKRINELTNKRINELTNKRISEPGIEGVKVATDTGIYAITDPDGKYHFPYIEVGQHLLKIDESTLPEGSVITTDNPYHVTVTEGVLTKVSFAVKLPPERINELTDKRINELTDKRTNEPLLKVSISQDPAMLKPRLLISHKIVTSEPTTKRTNELTDKRTNELIEFTITCNYHLFIARSNIKLYDKDYNLIKTIDLPNPIPSKFTLPISDLSFQTNKPTNKSTNQRTNEPTNERIYYQLSVYDKNNREDRTGIGEIEP
ncbi:MAG: hypothetical protein PHT32_02420 [Candidatus Omnitrophica bacterium]|nr:hypothetical protein [Candidatus Omnitrophota bacterium]